MPTIECDALDAQALSYTAGTWAGAWSSSAADTISQDLVCGVTEPGTITISRVGLVFDTSTLPAGAILTSAIVHLHQCVGTYTDAAAFTWHAVKPHNPIVLADYDNSGFGSDEGTIPVSVGMDPDQDVDMTDLSHIVPGTVRWALWMAPDWNNTDPGPGTWTLSFGGMLIGTPPTLSITYTLGAAPVNNAAACRGVLGL